LGPDILALGDSEEFKFLGRKGDFKGRIPANIPPALGLAATGEDGGKTLLGDPPLLGDLPSFWIKNRNI